MSTIEKDNTDIYYLCYLLIMENKDELKKILKQCIIEILDELGFALSPDKTNIEYERDLQNPNVYNRVGLKYEKFLEHNNKS